jgi:hypothetical protein
MRKAREYAGMCCQTAFSHCAEGIPANVLAHNIKQCPLAESVTQASDSADTSIMQPHSQGQLGMLPNMLADSFTTASLVQTFIETV